MNVVTAILVALHLPPALYMILVATALVSEEQDREGRCRAHGLDCSDPWIPAVAWIAVGLSLVLVVVNYVRLARRGTQRRWTFVLPLAFCVSQIGLLAILAAVNS